MSGYKNIKALALLDLIKKVKNNLVELIGDDEYQQLPKEVRVSLIKHHSKVLLGVYPNQIEAEIEKVLDKL